VTYPEFRNLVLSWELPETWAKRIWGRWQHILTKVTPADVEHAWRDTMCKSRQRLNTMLTDWQRVQANYRRRQREDRMSLCSYTEMVYWRKRARGWRLLFFLLLVIVLWGLRR